MFKAAAGALGWSPDIIWNTPVPQLILAIEGRYEYAVNTNPFGSPKKKLSKDKEEKIAAQRAKFAMLKMEARQKAKK